MLLKPLHLLCLLAFSVATPQAMYAQPKGMADNEEVNEEPLGTNNVQPQNNAQPQSRREISERLARILHRVAVARDRLILIRADLNMIHPNFRRIDRWLDNAVQSVVPLLNPGPVSLQTLNMYRDPQQIEYSDLRGSRLSNLRLSR